MTVHILTAQRLVQLATFHPKLQNTWYLLAAATFSACNEPQEIPRLYHFAMINELWMGQTLRAANKAIEITHDAENLQSQLNEVYREPTPFQKLATDKFREVLLKSSALTGLPKAINSLQALKVVTPEGLGAAAEQVDTKSDMAWTDTKRCAEQNGQQTIRDGIEHWSKIYNKVSDKVANNLNSSYPDLWQFTLCHVYGPLLSYDEVLSAQETSLAIIASLVPQDVNPQLWGHLKGAVNVGCDPETIDAARNLSILVATWCNVRWRSEVVKL
ncbi:Pxp2p [Lachancea thermotolerans CBS 6340]|uniref:KLTH0E01606p n=1 Tax=Lachancea thermotolerans (strain ATCC 56472 / CBS 6340 / NRRL Y-8284) TaxID=559295 RepID=C5DH61_LACTC|nr:KLTH0E01606p [Lachancea thermotolerans CBS 6340]CAR23122.1 KLTH0E01606p [Lachancea thermotolerans CBS 6340]